MRAELPVPQLSESRVRVPVPQMKQMLSTGLLYWHVSCLPTQKN